MNIQNACARTGIATLSLMLAAWSYAAPASAQVVAFNRAAAANCLPDTDWLTDYYVGDFAQITSGSWSTNSNIANSASARPRWLHCDGLDSNFRNHLFNTFVALDGNDNNPYDSVVGRICLSPNFGLGISCGAPVASTSFNGGGGSPSYTGSFSLFLDLSFTTLAGGATSAQYNWYSALWVSIPATNPDNGARSDVSGYFFFCSGSQCA